MKCVYCNEMIWPWQTKTSEIAMAYVKHEFKGDTDSHHACFFEAYKKHCGEYWKKVYDNAEKIVT